MKVKKAVIPAAGWGTRLLPASKAIPKEMIPVVDKPTIQYIIEEAVAAGIEDILIITGKGKDSIADHFDKSSELERALEEKGKQDLLTEVRDISSMIDIHYIRQKEALGLGHAISYARTFVGDDPFTVILGDDIVITDPDTRPAVGQMMNIYEETENPLIGVQQVPETDVDKYGIVNYKSRDGRRYRVKELIEKPTVAEAPSRLAILGRYVITPDIFPILEQTEPGQGGEIQLTDALQTLAQQRQLDAYNFIGNRYDVGNKPGYLRATVEFALNREDLGAEFRRYLKELVENLD